MCINNTSVTRSIGFWVALGESISLPYKQVVSSIANHFETRNWFGLQSRLCLQEFSFYVGNGKRQTNTRSTWEQISNCCLPRLILPHMGWLHETIGHEKANPYLCKSHKEMKASPSAKWKVFVNRAPVLVELVTLIKEQSRNARKLAYCW